MHERFIDYDDFDGIDDINDPVNLPLLRCLERQGRAESFLKSDGKVEWYLTAWGDLLFEQGELLDFSNALSPKNGTSDIQGGCCWDC